MTDQINHSEVARLRVQIDSEYAAACAGPHGLRAGSARHDFIQKQMERVADLGAGLIEQIGADAATSISCKGV